MECESLYCNNFKLKEIWQKKNLIILLFVQKKKRI
jgi:hypothetical protein